MKQLWNAKYIGKNGIYFPWGNAKAWKDVIDVMILGAEGIGRFFLTVSVAG